VPKDRIAVIIGAKGETARAIKKAAGCKEFNIDSDHGDIEVLWGEAGSYDPVKAMKLPDVVKAIGRGMAPNAAVTLLEMTIFLNSLTFVISLESGPTSNAEFVPELLGERGRFENSLRI
jgi:ribosomal RNA assembly protein